MSKSNRTQFQRTLIVIFIIMIGCSLDSLLIWIFDIKIPYWMGIARTFVLIAMGYAACWYQWFWKWNESVRESVEPITKGLMVKNRKLMDEMNNKYEARFQREKEDWLRRN